MTDRRQLYKRATRSQPRSGLAPSDGTGHPFTRSKSAGQQLQTHAILRSGKKVSSAKKQMLSSNARRSKITRPQKSQPGQAQKQQSAPLVKVKVSSIPLSGTPQDNTTRHPVQTPGPDAEVEPLLASVQDVNNSLGTLDVQKRLPSSSHAFRHDHSYSYGLSQGLQVRDARMEEKLRSEVRDLRHKLKLARRKMERARKSLDLERRMHNETQQTLQALMDSIQFQMES